jgi:hypothetical protein
LLSGSRDNWPMRWPAALRAARFLVAGGGESGSASVVVMVAEPSSQTTVETLRISPRASVSAASATTRFRFMVVSFDGVVPSAAGAVGLPGFGSKDQPNNPRFDTEMSLSKVKVRSTACLSRGADPRL